MSLTCTLNVAQPTFLIVHPGALGDVLLSLPAIQALRTAYPRHEIGIIAGQAVGMLLRECRVIDRLFPVESRVLADLFTGPEAVTPDVMEWLSRCQSAVCWMADGGGAVTRSLHKLGCSHVIARSLSDIPDSGSHLADRILDTIRGLVQVSRQETHLRLPAHVCQVGAQVLSKMIGGTRQPVVVVHAGSGSRHKCCRPEVLVHVVERLHQEGAVPVLLEGPADKGATREVARACRTLPIILENLDLVSVAGVLAHAACVVGHDSGVSHLAAALHVPTVVLFGPTDPKRWAPRGRYVTVLTGSDCQCETWKAVQRCEAKSCLQIPTDSIMAACNQMIQSGSGR